MPPSPDSISTRPQPLPVPSAIACIHSSTHLQATASCSRFLSVNASDSGGRHHVLLLCFPMQLAVRPAALLFPTVATKLAAVTLSSPSTRRPGRYGHCRQLLLRLSPIASSTFVSYSDESGKPEPEFSGTRTVRFRLFWKNFRCQN
jgi:hypothetical protein